MKSLIYIGIGAFFTLVHGLLLLLLIAIVVYVLFGILLFGIWLIVEADKNEMDRWFTTKDNGKFHYCKRITKETKRKE